MSKNLLYYAAGKVKFRKDNKNTKSHFLKILRKSIQSGVKSVYDSG